MARKHNKSMKKPAAGGKAKSGFAKGKSKGKKGGRP